MQPESRLEENSTAELTRAIAICHSRHLISDKFMPRRHNVQLVEPHPEACLSPPRGRPFVPRCTASSGQPGSGWSSAFRARPVRANHSDLPRRLHATHPDSIRSLRSLRRDGDCLSFFALGRDNRSLRRGAANALGLTNQNPVRSVYLTSGPSRLLHFGALVAQLRHAPRWQLVAPHRPAGNAVRALAWLGPREVETGIEAIVPKLSAEDFDELVAARALLPAWMAEPLGAWATLPSKASTNIQK